MVLRLFGKKPDSVFDINGRSENSATFALGWVLEKSPVMLGALLHDVSGVVGRCHDTRIELQHYLRKGGLTDIEISCPNTYDIIIEAKSGWVLPSLGQLRKYAVRLKGKNTVRPLIVSVSAANTEYAQRHLPPSVDRIPLKHRSWADLQRLAAQSSRKARTFEEKLWLRQLENHLEYYASMQSTHDNRVFVVSLSSSPASKDPNYSFIDVVEKDSRYFHPIGQGWPVEAPNYVGFRYHGRLQSVHHIDKYDVVRDLESKSKKWPSTNRDFFVYRLGPPMKPGFEIKTGKIYRNGRVWCAIDTLLSGTCKTIADARDETKKRYSKDD